jgi:glycosyltransferase involved in cell wall biosynthesis
MRIALISQQGIREDGFWGGINSHAKSLTKILLKLGHDVTVFTAKTSPLGPIQHDGENGGLTTFYIGSVRKNGQNKYPDSWIDGLRMTYLSAHRKRPFDCILTEGASAWGLHALFTELMIPVFAFVHNFGIVHFYNIWKEVDNLQSLISYFARTVPRILWRTLYYDFPFLRNSRWVISGSMFNATLLKRFYRIRQSRLRVIHNWIDTEQFSPNLRMRIDTRNRLGIPNDVLVFLLVGSLWRPKGFQIAINSFKYFVEYFPNSRLMIAGRGPYERQLRRLQQTGSLTGDEITFLGLVPNSQLPAIYNAADIFLSPSLLSEVLPYVLLEAMSCGLPVIATKLGGSKEAVGRAGMLVSAGNIKGLTDAMVALARDPETMKSFSIRSRKRALALFSEQKAEEKLSALFDITFRTPRTPTQDRVDGIEVL